ncbi:MAG: SpoIIE family protein phosphatase [Luteitalea sp.]|nr:SpoIIE family protein phosphatase [Luteitalea sp.]
MRISWAAATHPGLRRSVNEDAFGARPDLGLFIVADGMGGHAAGDVASRLAVEEIEGFIAATVNAEDENMPRGDLRAAFVHANQRLTRAMRAEARLRGMATTASAVLVGRTDVAIAHVGDSRVYRLRQGRLTQLTRDHSWVQEEVDAGRLSITEARHSMWRHIVTRALTGIEDPTIDVTSFTLEVGDRILLCSDGLTSVVDDDRIRDVLGAEASLERASGVLIDEANRAGGPDNITAIGLQIDGF